MKRDANCQLLLLFSDCFFFFFNVHFSAVSCSLVPVRATKPFNDVESCLLQEEICGGRGYTGEPSWIFTKSNTFSFLFFFTIWLKAQWGRVIVPLHSDLPCRQRKRFYVFGLGSLLRKENLLDKQYNSSGQSDSNSLSYCHLQSLQICHSGKQCLFMLL